MITSPRPQLPANYANDSTPTMPNQPTPTQRRRSPVLAWIRTRLKTPITAILLVCFLAWTMPAQAVTYTWNGGGADNLWGTAANWGGTAPTPSSTNSLVFAGTTRLSPINNYGNGNAFQDISFAAAAGAFTLNGDGSNNGIDWYGNIINSSTNLQTLNFGFYQQANNQVQLTSGDIAFGSSGLIYQNSRNLTVTGASGRTATFNGVIANGSGAGKLILGSATTDAPTVIFNVANTYTGETDINTGTLQLNVNQGASWANTANIFVGNGGSTFGNTSGALLLGASGITVSNNITTNKADNSGAAGTGTRTLGGNFSSGTSTFSGGISINGGLVVTAATGGTVNFTNVISDGIDTGVVLRSLTKAGAGTVNLSGANSYSGITVVQGGNLGLDGNTGSLTSPALTFNGGGGTFNYQGAAAGSAQAFTGALTFSAGGSNVQSTYGTSGNTSLTFASLASRTAGATGNFVTSGGANGTTNKIVLTAQATGFINQGTFYNSNDYAYNDAGGFVRGINYGVDASTATTAGGATLGVTGQHVQLTGNVASQTTASINTLKISGGNALNVGTGQTLTLTNAGLLKTGGNLGQITGGTIAAGAAELVIRTGSASDQLRIDSIISGSGGVTITGPGVTTLYGANTFTGSINIAGGTLAVNTINQNNPTTEGATVFGAAGARTINVLGGGTFMNLGLVGINIKATTKVFSIGTGGGTLYNNPSAILTLDDAGQLVGPGDLTVASPGNGLIIVGNAATAGTFSGNVTINGGTLRVINNVAALSSTAGRSFTVNNNGSLDVGIAAFNPGTGTVITLNGNGINNTGALQATAVNGSTANNIVLGSNASIGATSTFTLGLSGVISGSSSLTKVGAGTGAITLSGLNTYTGNTIVNAGVLIADSVTNAAPINSASGLVLSGSGTFRYTGLAATARAMTMNGLTLAGGAGIVDANNTGTSTTLTLGTITRPVGGGSVDFRATTGTLGAGANTNIASTGLTNGIFGAFATAASGASLATKDGSNNVVAYAAHTDVNTNGSVLANAAASNVRIQTVSGAGNITLGAAVTDINTLFQSTATAVTIDNVGGTLRFGSVGGIIASPTASTTGTVTIGTAANSGILTAGGADNTAGEIIVNTAAATPVTINSTITDNGTGVVSLTRTGLTAASLTLNGTNTFSGPLSINSGTVVIGTAGLANINTASAIGKGSAGGSAADLVLNGGSLQYALNLAPQSTDRLFSVGLGNGTLDSSSATAANIVSFTNTGAIGFNGQSGSRTLTLAGTNTGANLLAGVLGDNGGVSHLTKSAAGTWVITGNNTYSGTTTVSAGTLQVGNGGTTGSVGTGYLSLASTLAFNRSDNVTLPNVIAGTTAGIVAQNAASTLTLTGFGNQTGGLRFNGADGGTIDLAQDMILLGTTSIAGSASGSINGTLGGRLILGVAGGDVGVANGKTLTINAVIADGTQTAIDFFNTNNGTGVVVLTADNTFSGTTNIQSGVISVAKIGNSGVAGNLGMAGTISLGSTTTTTGTLRYTGTGETNNRVINLAGTTAGGIIDQSGTGLLKFTGTNTATGAGAKVLTLQGSTAGTGELSGAIVDNSANVNTTGVTKAGTGTWTLSAANTYTGPTTVNGGALILGNLLAAQNSVVTSTVTNSATTGLVFATGLLTPTLGGLGGSQNFAMQDTAGTAFTSLTIGGSTLTTGGTFSGALSGTANITKTGPSTQTFSGINTYTGKTIITGGTLAITTETGLGANPGASTADQLTINGGTLAATASFTIDDANRGIQLGNGASGTGTIDVASAQLLIVQNAITGTGASLVKAGGGTLQLNTTPTYTGGTTINAGRITFGAGATFPAGALTINGGALLYNIATPDITTQLVTIGASGLTIDVVPSAINVPYATPTNLGNAGTGGLTKVGAGTLTLTNSAATGATYTGATTVGAGTLALNFGAQITPIVSTSSVLTLGGGALSLVGGSVAGAATQTFASANLTVGESSVFLTKGTATTVAEIYTGGITARAAGSSVNFGIPASTSVNVGATGLNTAGILGGWATYELATTAGVATDWATKDGGNLIIPYASGSYITLAAGNGTTAGANTNFTLATGTVTMTSVILANTLRLSGAATVALGTNTASFGNATGGISSNVGAGGILYSATTGTGTISGTTTNTGTGFINAPATTSDLPIYVSTGGTLTISAGVGGTVTGFGITKSGGGTLNITNGGTTPNNYTGVTTINGGTLSVDNANRLGGSTGITLNGGALAVSNTTSITQPLTLGLNGGALNNTGGAGNVNWTSTTAIAFLGSGSRTLTFNNNNTGRFGVLSAAIGDGGGPTSLVINASSDTGLLQFSGASSTYSGATTINRGVLRMNAASALSPNSNLVFAATGTNRAILEYNTVGGTSFTGAVGTAAGQVQWTGNGGFSTGNQTSFIVNLGGAAAPLTWNSGGFVPTGFELQFHQQAANNFTSTGTVDFQNPIDLASASRTVNVADGASQVDTTLSGVISSAGVGGVLNKTGSGALRLTANNSASTNTAVTVSSGYVIFPTTTAIPQTTGANVTINSGGAVVLTGSTTPLTTIGSRIAASSAGSIALDTSTATNIDFTGYSNLALGAFNTTMGQPVVYTGTITPAATVYRLAPGRGGSSGTAATTGNTLVNMGQNTGTNILVLPNANTLVDTAARSLAVGSGATYLSSYNAFTGGTTITGVNGNAVIGIGNDAALGSGTVAVSGGNGYLGALNGDHALNNNVTVATGNWVASADSASDGITNPGSMTYNGTVATTGAVSIFGRTRTPIFLGNLTATGTLTINNTVAIYTTAGYGGIAKGYAQATSIADNATILFDSNASFGTGTNGTTLGNATLRLMPGTGSVTLTGRTVAVTTNKAPVFDVATGGTLTLPGVISGGGNQVIAKNGQGTLTLTAANTWTSTATNGLQIVGGTVLIDGTSVATARFTNATTTQLTLGTGTNATLSNGGTFGITAGANTIAQTFTNLVATAKENALSLTATSGQANLVFNGATFNRNAIGGTVAITSAVGAGSTSITLTGTVTSGATTANQIVLDAGATGNPFMTINGTDWAARNGSNLIVALGSAGAGSYTLSTASALAGNADMDVTFPTTTLATPTTTLTSLRFNAAAAETIDLNANTLITGGILVGTGAGTNNQTITGTGSLQGVASRDLVIINANTNGDGIATGLLTIASSIGNNTGATALTKSGPGTLVLSGNNSFTSSIYLNNGVLSIASAGNAAAANPLGQMTAGTTNVLFNGGNLRFTGSGSTTTDRGFTFNTNGNVEASNAAGTLVINQVVTGIANVPGLLVKTGPGALSLSGTTDNPNASVTVSAGTLNLDKASTASVMAVSGGTGGAGLIVANGATAKITGSGGNQINDGSSIVLIGTGNLDLNGNSETIDALAGTGVISNTGANASPLTLTLGSTTNNTSNISAYTLAAALAEAAGGTGVRATGLASFSGTISDNGSNKIALAKGGAGTQTLSYTGGTSTYTYAGDTTITSGTLQLRGTDLLPTGTGKGNVTLVGNTVINGITVPGILDMGGFNQSINGLTGAAGSIVMNTPLSSVSADQTNTITVGGNDQSSSFDGIFQDGYVIKPGTTPVGYKGFLAVTKTGTGTLTLTGTNTNTGVVTINGGRIDLNATAVNVNTGVHDNALATNVAINASGTLKLLASNQILDAKTVTTSGGSFDLNGFTETVGVSLTSGSIIDGAGGGALSSNSAFDLQAGTVSGKLSGTSGLNKTTSGTVTLGGSQTHNFSGATAISAGTLTISSGASISASSGITLSGTGKLYVDGSTNSGVGITVGNATTLGGSGTINGTVTASTGAIIEAGHISTGILTLDTINFGGAGVLNLFNIDGGSASILNILTGLTTTSGGGNAVTINATNAGSVANGTYKLIDVGTLTWGATNNNFTIGTISGLGGRQSATPSFIDNDALYIIIAGANPVWSGALSTEWSDATLSNPKNWLVGGVTPTDYINSPTADTVLFDDTATGTTIVDITVANVSPNGVTFDNSTLNYTLQGSASITGSTSFVKSGTGTLTINNANAFTGGLVINGGIVKLGNASALGTSNSLTFGASAASGTKLQLFGNSATLTGLSTNATPGSPVVENGDATTNSVLTVNLASGTNTFAGVLQDGAAATLGLAKQGNGTLILTGANTLTGGNSVTAGTLQIGNGGTSGLLTGDTSISSGAFLTFSRSDASTYSGAISGAGTLTKLGAGTLSLTGAAAQTGGTTITAGTLQIGNGGTTGSLTGAISNNATLAYNRSDASVVPGNISGTGAVSVVAGTMIVSGTNSYLGTTTTASGSTFQIGNGGTTGSIGAGALINNGTIAFNRSDNITVSTAITSGALRQMGNGSSTLILTGANTYTGGTTIDSGATLQVGNGTVGSIIGMDGAGTNTVTSSGTLAFNRTGTHTWDNVLAGGSLSIVAGNWTATTNNTYSGSTSVSSGATLTVGTGSTTGSIGTGAITDNGGLIFNRSDGYTLTTGNLVTGSGSVTVGAGGTLTAAVNNQFNTTGALVIGLTNGATTIGSLDLGSNDSTFGSMTAQTNSATPDVVNIGTGKTLTLTGGAAAVMTIGANSAANTTTNVNFTGGGNLAVSRSGGIIQIGGATGATNTNAASLNLSGLATFTADLGPSGVFRLGDQAGTSLTTVETFTGAATNTITTGTLSVGDNTGSGTGAKTFNLGGTANTLNVNTINLGDTNNGNSGRGSGVMQFAGGTGTLVIRSATGATGTANLNLVNTAGGTGTQLTGQLLLLGHNVDASFNNIVMAQRSGSTTQGADSVLSFDTGTLSANNLNMVARTGATLTTGASTGIVNIGGTTGGTTATFGTVNMAVNSVITAVSTAAGNATATMNITGIGTTAITTLNMSANSLGAATSAAAATSTINIGVAGGTPNVGLGIVTMSVNTAAATGATNANSTINIAAGAVTATSIAMANTSILQNTSTATLSITGGSLTVSGDITTTNGLGTENTTLTLNGGTLDMTNGNIGTASNVVGSGTGALTFQSGTLKNVATINGTAGLTKTTGGTLILEGTNTYTGATVISAGILQVGSGSITGTLGTDTGAIANSGTLAINRSDAFSLANVVSGSGGISQIGAGTTTLTGLNSYSGTTSITAGALQVGLAGTGRTGTGAISVTGGTIHGTGTVRGSSFTLGTGAGLQAGDGTAASDIGTLTFTPVTTGNYNLQSGSTTALGISTPNNDGAVDSSFGGNAFGSAGYNAWVDAFAGLGTGSHDLLVFGGSAGSSLTINGNLTVVGTSFTALQGQVFKLLDWSSMVGSTAFHSRYTGVTNFIGNGDETAGLDLPDLSSSGLSWDISRLTTSGNIVVVPEPSRALLLIFGLLSLLGGRRRRCRSQLN